MNRAIDSAAAEQRCVSRVYNGIDLDLRDVSADDFDLSFCHVERSETSLI
jgi:hypothetical protein